MNNRTAKLLTTCAAVAGGRPRDWKLTWRAMNARQRAAHRRDLQDGMVASLSALSYHPTHRMRTPGASAKVRRTKTSFGQRTLNRKP